MEDYYKIIGTNREAVYHVGLTGKERTDEEKDAFLKEKYEHTIKLIDVKKTIAISQGKKQYLEELNYQAKKVDFAYRQIETPILREIYNRELDERKREKNHRIRKIRKKSAYQILSTQEETILRQTEEEGNRILRQKRDQLLNHYSEMLVRYNSFRDKMKIEFEMQKVKDAYELVKTADRREIYHIRLQEQKKEENEEIRKLKIKNQYSHTLEYNPNLIANKQKSKDGFPNNKMVAREECKTVEEYLCADRENRDLRIRATAKISFTNYSGVYQSYINEYEIRRKVKGNEKVDIVYTELSMDDLLDEKQEVDKDYYNCVVDELFAEDTIEGSKYNDGYIGNVEKNKEGNYNLTLGRTRLRVSELEMLTAIMILKKQEKKIKEEEKGEK